ncbi:oxidoreductase [Paramyrothecium foliicola]|nr:oxidoreductase [Paramyrothecium foliicola]
MHQSKKAAKRKQDQGKPAQPDSIKKPRLSESPAEGPDKADGAPIRNLNAIISPEEIDITVDTLQTLAGNPAVIKSKACRELRSAVYDFRQACTTGTNSNGGATAAVDAGNLTARISGALVDGKYTDALVLLAEMRIRNEAPKLGALCRWVRDLDVTSGLSSDRVLLPSGELDLPARSQEQLELLRVLDSVLRVTGTHDLLPSAKCIGATDPIALHEEWNLRSQTDKTIATVRERVLDGSIFSACPDKVQERFRVLETVPAAQRKPPNLHDAVLFLSDDDAVPLSQTPPATTFHKHPYVPNLSLMRDVLSPDECLSIVASMEKIGFLPDSPLRDDGAGSSILAHNVYWMIDQAFHDKLWDRVKAFVPADVSGKKARGINRRFRVYRYVPGAEYRCHFDGAWPPSGLHPKTGAYMYDSSPPEAKQSSLFTFLVYLNDDFEGGETTFFTPSLREGVMNAYPVRPIAGSIALFPHGDSKGALLHEGTGVRSGAKYIIRSDVEYDVNPGHKVEQLGRHDEPRLLGVLDQAVVKLGQRHNDALYALAVVQALLGQVVALAQLGLDHDELHVGVGHARVGGLDGADAEHAAVVARLLLELAHGGLLGRLLGVDEAGGPLDRVGVERGPVLDDDHGRRRPRGVQQDVAHGHGVDAGLAPRLAGGHLPGARGADLVGVLDLLQRHPLGLAGRELRHPGDDGFLCCVRHAEAPEGVCEADRWPSLGEKAGAK